MKRFTGKQIVRLITLGLIVAYLFYAVCFYAREIHLYTPQIDYADGMLVDGAEMAPILNVFVAGTNGMIAFVTMLISVLAVLVIGLILLVPWRCIALRKSSQVSEKEWIFTKNLFYIFCVASCITGAVILRFSNLLYLIILTAVAASLIAIFALLPIQRAYVRCESKKEEAEAKKYRTDVYIPVIRASICNGEQVAGFKERKTGHFEEIILVRSEKDLQDFKEKYGVENITKEY